MSEIIGTSIILKIEEFLRTRFFLFLRIKITWKKKKDDK
jgi:hypothetical protein